MSSKRSYRTGRIPTQPRRSLKAVFERSGVPALVTHAQALTTLILGQWARAEDVGIWVRNEDLNPRKVGARANNGYSSAAVMDALVDHGYGTRKEQSGPRRQCLIPTSKLLRYLKGEEAAETRDRRVLENQNGDLQQQVYQLDDQMNEMQDINHARFRELEEQLAEQRRLLDAQRSELAAVWDAIRWVDQNDNPITPEKLERRLQLVK